MLNPLNTASLALCRSAVFSVKQHHDKKPLEGYNKDSERVHHWLPIEK